MKFWKLVSVTTALALSVNVNASILNTINDVNYEWLEFSETKGMSRFQVESLLNDPTSTLYGYTYASRSLTADLFASYITWDGLTGYHGNAQVVDGMWQMISDFGANASAVRDYTLTAVDTNEPQYYNGELFSWFIYGSPTDCDYPASCSALLDVFTNDGAPVLTQLDARWGLDPFHPYPSLVPSYFNKDTNSSLLVREISAVPIPAPIWLFGSGLIGLIGLARRKA